MDRDLIWTGDERRLVLGKKSGVDPIRWPDLLVQVKELGVRKLGLVTDEEFRELAAS